MRNTIRSLLCLILITEASCRDAVKKPPPAAEPGSSGVACGPGRCDAGQFCRERTLLRWIGPRFISQDGTCPGDGMSRGECVGHPGVVCCVKAVPASAETTGECLDVPQGCSECSCLPSDICGTPGETVQICRGVSSSSIMCEVPAL